MFAHAGPRDWSTAVKRWSHAQPQFGTTGRSNGTIYLKPSVLSQPVPQGNLLLLLLLPSRADQCDQRLAGSLHRPLQ
ncbi:hypothetical protein IscW_ISCW007388 [Ixodes scapularis]|uniref:Uncharacterized protein n=1 Tax=Ixodes scapularis TaxID=6945 RepID=B7PSU6_IXOSC|nr:hypothetical protein IscW_ISCW007388 [Ixodes scapularis]|eukprot:XP_002403124.1 hypothetical protein IscW_ISCW007388 [Ixodes scapularis]